MVAPIFVALTGDPSSILDPCQAPLNFVRGCPSVSARLDKKFTRQQEPGGLFGELRHGDATSMMVGVACIHSDRQDC